MLILNLFFVTVQKINLYNSNKSYTNKSQVHIACNYGYKNVCIDFVSLNENIEVNTQFTNLSATCMKS